MAKMYRVTKFVRNKLYLQPSIKSGLKPGTFVIRASTKILPDFHGAKTNGASSIYYHANYESQLRDLETSSGAGGVCAGQGVEVETQCGSSKSWGRYCRALPGPRRLPR